MERKQFRSDYEKLKYNHEILMKQYKDLKIHNNFLKERNEYLEFKNDNLKHKLMDYQLLLSSVLKRK